MFDGKMKKCNASKSGIKNVRVIILLLIFSCSSFNLFAQVPVSIDQKLKEKISSFIPEQFDLLDFKPGLLNNDTLEDLIVILKSKNESIQDSIWKAEWLRPLLILLQQKDGKYKLQARVDSLVLCQTCGGMKGDPYQGMDIGNNSFTLYFYGGMRYIWTYEIAFTYDPLDDEFYLTKDEEGEYDSLQLDSIYPVTNNFDPSIKVSIEKFRWNFE